MSNPRGINQLSKNPVHGDIKRLTTLTKSAPMSGAPSPSIEGAPKRAQRQAVRGGQQAPSGGAAPPQPPTEVPYNTRLAMAWEEIRAHAPDDQLVNYYADLAQRNAGG